jgi:S-adenosylmethionine hydrolase
VPTCYDLITLVTDYGLAGGFVGSLHAVIDEIAAERSGSHVRILDLDHSIPPQDVLLGALRMERLLPYTRRGVHVGIVDPGVGTARRPVALRAGGRVFVGPDNGLLMFAADSAGGAAEAVVLERYLLPHPSATFHGRDIFAPAAAHVACGMRLSELGRAIDPASLARLERPVPRAIDEGGAEVRVVQVDGFGNVQFGAGPDALARLGGAGGIAELAANGGSVPVTIGMTFGDVAIGEPVLLVDSDECLALSVNHGRADALLGGLRPGDAVKLSPR